MEENLLGLEILESNPAVDALYHHAMRFAGSVVDYKELMMMYTCAIQEIKTKLEILDTEYNVRYRRNPITSITSRLKKSSSIMENCLFSEQRKEMAVEIQIRTIAMDFWASLEHQMKYKQEIPNQQEIIDKLEKCAEVISQTDREMLKIRRQIEESSDKQTEEDILLEKIRKLDINIM